MNGVTEGNGLGKFKFNNLKGKFWNDCFFNKKSVSYVDWAIPAQYDRVSKKFSENLAGVILNGKVGFIGRKNRFIIPPKFDAVKDLQSFSQGLAVVCVNGKYGFINKRGEFVIEPVYEWADNFRDNLLASVKQGGKYELTK